MFKKWREFVWGLILFYLIISWLFFLVAEFANLVLSVTQDCRSFDSLFISPAGAYLGISYLIVLILLAVSCVNCRSRSKTQDLPSI